MVRKSFMQRRQVISIFFFILVIVAVFCIEPTPSEKVIPLQTPSITLGDKITVGAFALGAKGGSLSGGIGRVGPGNSGDYTFDKAVAKAGQVDEKTVSGNRSVNLRDKHKIFGASTIGLIKNDERQALSGKMICEGWIQVDGDCNIWKVVVRLRGSIWGIMSAKGFSTARSGNLTIDGEAQTEVIARSGEAKIIKIPIKKDKTFQIQSFTKVDTYTIDWLGFSAESYDNTGAVFLGLTVNIRQYVISCECIDP